MGREATLYLTSKVAVTGTTDVMGCTIVHTEKTMHKQAIRLYLGGTQGGRETATDIEKTK